MPEALTDAERGEKWPRIGEFRVAASGEVTIVMNEAWRGKHLSADLVHAGTKAIEADAPKLSIAAYVGVKNTKAQRAFERAGWLGRTNKPRGQRPLRTVTRGGKTFIKYLPDPRFWRAAGKRVSKSRGRNPGRRWHGRGRMHRTPGAQVHAGPKRIAVSVPTQTPGRHQRTAGTPQRVYPAGGHRSRKQAARSLRRRRGRPERPQRVRGPRPKRRIAAAAPCSNLRVCVVGNGPSAEGKGAEIDAYDFIVRTSIFPLALRGAGTKLDAWCWNGNPRICPRSMQPPAGRYETWLSVHTSYRKVYKKYLRHASTLAKKHGVVRMVPERLWNAMRSAVRCHPSTGFAAVAYVLEHLKPKVLALYGFDATVRGAPGWGDAHKTLPWRVAKGGYVCGHNLLLEKRIIRQLMKTGTWLGRRYGTKVVWPARPGR